MLNANLQLNTVRRLVVLKLALAAACMGLLAVLLAGGSHWYYRLDAFMAEEAGGTLVTFAVDGRPAADGVLVAGEGLLTLSLPKGLARYTDIY
jgi:hypothetical protein